MSRNLVHSWLHVCSRPSSPHRQGLLRPTQQKKIIICNEGSHNDECLHPKYSRPPFISKTLYDSIQSDAAASPLGSEPGFIRHFSNSSTWFCWAETLLVFDQDHFIRMSVQDSLLLLFSAKYCIQPVQSEPSVFYLWVKTVANSGIFLSRPSV